MRGDAAKWAVLGVVVIASVSGVYYQYQNTRPCTTPILFSLGSVDTRFDTSRTTIIETAEAAAAIWNKAAGKTILAYDPSAALQISLIYDEREANAKLGSRIASEQAAHDIARAALDDLQAQYATQLNAYNRKIEFINARGGATKKEAATLDSELARLTALSRPINSAVKEYNADVAALNAIVSEYNRSAGRVFQQGEYVRDSAGERINVYAFTGNVQLKRVLAHEFGHALDLDHNDNPKSIMYAKNESGNLVPTPSDLTALRAVCGS